MHGEIIRPYTIPERTGTIRGIGNENVGIRIRTGAICVRAGEEEYRPDRPARRRRDEGWIGIDIPGMGCGIAAGSVGDGERDIIGAR